MTARLVASFVLAALAFGVPWLTHFADGGLSFLSHLAWIGLALETLVRFRGRGLWVLLGAPLAMFWPVSLAIIMLRGDLYLGF
jgi:hypothetical protein